MRIKSNLNRRIICKKKVITSKWIVYFKIKPNERLH